MKKLGLTRTVQAILLTTPFTSWRDLAGYSEVSHSLLAYIAKGKREATPAVAQKLLGAIDFLEAELHYQGSRLRRALRAAGSTPRPRPRRRTRS